MPVRHSNRRQDSRSYSLHSGVSKAKKPITTANSMIRKMRKTNISDAYQLLELLRGIDVVVDHDPNLLDRRRGALAEIMDGRSHHF